MEEVFQIPTISSEKSYWLVRSQGGKYYDDFRRKGIIAINWDYISVDDIKTLNDNQLTAKVKEEYPKKVSPGRASAQLRIFVNNIKKGDTVIITSYSSTRISIGEVLEDDCFLGNFPADTPNEDNPNLCTYRKRKRVKWNKEVSKYDLEMPLFKFIQHSRNTINSADEFGNLIEGNLHEFFIKGDSAFFTLKVKRESNIPAKDFFKMGAEILDLVDEFGVYRDSLNISSEGISTKINVNSEGTAKFIGPVAKVVVVAVVTVICLTGGGGSVTLPEISGFGGGEFNLETNGLLREFTDFLDAKQEREHKDLLIKQYMHDLEIEAPDELKGLIDSIENSDAGNS